MANFLKSLFGGKTQEPKEQEGKKNFEIFKYDGLRAQRMGNICYAEKCYDNALLIQEDFETMSYLNQIYMQTSRFDEAHKLLARMIEMEPALPDTYLHLANLCDMQNLHEEMETLAAKAVELDGENAVAHYLLAKAMSVRGNDIMAIAGLTKAIALKEDYDEALLLRAEVLMRMAQYAEAAKDIDAILERTPGDESAMLLQGKLKEATGDACGAEECYKSVIEADPFGDEAFLLLAQLYIQQKRFAEAINMLDDAIDMNPDFARAYYERGRAKLLNGDKEGAMADSRKAIELEPKEEERFSGTFNTGGQEERINILGI